MGADVGSRSPAARIPDSVAAFLRGGPLAVAGVSRQSGQAANAVFRKLIASGHVVYPINPAATEVEGVRCYPNVAALPEPVHGVVVATPPSAAAEVVRECAAHGVKHVWFHRSFGPGSVSDDAVRECLASGLSCIVGGCPLMYCDPVDVGHRCMRWLLGWRGRLPT